MSAEWSGQVDVVVVGGGIIGLAVAEELLHRGREVIVLERGRPGCGATWAAGGMLAPVSEAELGEDVVVALGMDSLGRYPGWVERIERATGLECGYRTEGTLWVATNRDDAEELAHLETTLAGRGLAFERLDPRGVGESEPHLSGRVLAALRVAGDHQVDPRELALCLAQAIRSAGGRLVGGASVSSIGSDGASVGEVVGETREGDHFRLRPRQVVLAAGAWAGRRLELPIPDPGVRPVKGQLVRLRGEPLVRHVVRTPDVYLIPRASGELLIGATMEEMGFDLQPTAGAVMDLLRHGWEVLPGIYDLELSEVSVGLRSATDDHLPLIGPTVIDGLFLALGHYRNGVLLAPATAAHLGAMISGEAASSVAAPFLPSRAEATSRATS